MIFHLLVNQIQVHVALVTCLSVYVGHLLGGPQFIQNFILKPTGSYKALHPHHVQMFMYSWNVVFEEAQYLRMSGGHGEKQKQNQN